MPKPRPGKHGTSAKATSNVSLSSFLDENGQDFFYKFDHTFILRKLDKSCALDSVQVEFVPIDQGWRRQAKKAHAVFNHDRRYYTPAFIMGKDLDDYEETPTFDLDRFADKVKFVETKHNSDFQEILVPKPSGRYCQICKIEYEDYIEHWQSQDHQTKAKSSRGRKYIQDLLKKYERKRRKKSKYQDVLSSLPICRSLRRSRKAYKADSQKCYNKRRGRMKGNCSNTQPASI